MLRGYVICCTARTGSSLVCQAAASTGVLGRPREYFNLDDVLSEHPDYPRHPDAQPEALLKLATTPNGVYGLKVIAYQVETGRAPPDWARRLPNLSFVHLYRRDLLRQAISDVRALQTSVFRHGLEPRAEPVYDAGAIQRKMEQILRFDARWRLFFGRNGIEPLEVAYETFLAAPQPVLNALGRLVGVEAPPQMQTEQISLRLQRDALTEAWRERFVAERGDLTRFDAL